MDVDGFYYFWPQSDKGHFAAHHLRSIADKLDELNGAWEKGLRSTSTKTRCSGQWTESRFTSFIKGGLRQMSLRWAPIQQCKKRAWLKRGWYRCEQCHAEVPTTIKLADGKRVKGIYVDHIQPIIDPAIGFTSWDDVINRMFCELDGLQCICKVCHDTKTQEEKQIAALRRQKEDQ
jgi:hypothetical protein